MNFEKDIYNIYSMTDYHHSNRQLYTNIPFQDSFLNNEKNLIVTEKGYITEYDFYIQCYSELNKLIETVKQSLQLQKITKAMNEKDNKLKKEFGTLYNNLIIVIDEYNLDRNNIYEELKLPKEENYKKFKRNITKRMNKLNTISKLTTKNKDQIASMYEYNLVKLKYDWINYKLDK